MIWKKDLKLKEIFIILIFFDSKFAYNTSNDVDLHELFEIYTDFNVDQGWIQIYSNIKTVFSIQLFDIFPIPEKPLESMRFIGSHIFSDFRRVDENLYNRETDLLYIYETGFSLEGLRIKRLGGVGEQECDVRIKMIWRKFL